MARYRLLSVGVIDTLSSLIVTPASGPPWEDYQAWLRAGNTPDQFVPAANPAETLLQAKARRVAQIRADGMARIRTRFPGIGDFEMLQLVREIVLSVVPAARALTADMQWASDTYGAGKAAIAAVQAATTIPQVDAVVPAWPA